MGLWTSNGMIKALSGAAIVVGIIGVYNQPMNDKPCTQIAYYPDRSAVYQCPAGLSTVVLTNTTKVPIWTTITTDKQAEAWLTTVGDGETLKTLTKHLGAPVVLGENTAFLADSSGSGLVYIDAKTSYLVTVVWDVKTK